MALFSECFCRIIVPYWSDTNNLMELWRLFKTKAGDTVKVILKTQGYFLILMNRLFCFMIAGHNNTFANFSKQMFGCWFSIVFIGLANKFIFTFYLFKFFVYFLLCWEETVKPFLPQSYSFQGTGADDNNNNNNNLNKHQMKKISNLDTNCVS